MGAHEAPGGNPKAAGGSAVAQPPNAAQLLRTERDPVVRQRALDAIAAILDPKSFTAEPPRSQ